MWVLFLFIFLFFIFFCFLCLLFVFVILFKKKKIKSMNLIEPQTRARQEPFDFMSVRVADEKKSCILVPYNFAINENMVEA